MVNNEWVRLYPVFYIPGLNDHLLSLGQFHHSGLSSRGDTCTIVLYDGNDEEFLTFHPRTANSTIYMIKSLLGTEEDYSLSTIYISIRENNFFPPFLTKRLKKAIEK